MTLNQLASIIAKREGKRSQARIGDIREILKILFTLKAEYIVASGGVSEIDHLDDAMVNKRLKKIGRRKDQVVEEIK